MTKQDFQTVVNFIEEMKATSSTNDKKSILQKYDSPVLRKLFEYVYSPFKQYYVTSDNLKKRQDLSFDNYDDLFSLLDDLNERRVTGHSAIQSVNGFIEKNKEFADVIYDVIDRNLKTRATTTLINSVMPGTVPTFDVALAEKFEGNEKKVNFDSGEWWASRKLDGVRCLAVIDENGDIKFYSRAGNEFLTLGVLAEELKSLNLRSVVLDGEVCIMKDGGLEDFQGIIKEIGRKEHTIQNPMYYVFDMLQNEEFNNQSGEIPLSTRLLQLGVFFSLHSDLKCVAPLVQIQVNT
jgi:DNA ligase-1